MKDLEIAIIGGGIGGLCCALALRRHGLAAHVYERAPELAEVGAGITLWANATRVLEHVGVYEALVALGSPIGRSGIGTADGELLVDSDWASALAEVGTSTLGIHRADLQRALYEAVGPENVTPGARCVSFEQDGARAVARFEGREDVAADLLIGADGIHSAVRAGLLDDGPPRYAGYTCWRGIVPSFPEWGGAPGSSGAPGSASGWCPSAAGASTGSPRPTPPRARRTPRRGARRGYRSASRAGPSRSPR